MKLNYSKNFLLQFRKLSETDKILVKETIGLFVDEPYNPILKNHALRKPQFGQRAISASDDLRIVFREKGEYTDVLMIDIGNHNQVYLR